MDDFTDNDKVTIDPNIAAVFWLLSATKDICDDAKARIEHEVREHFVAKYNEESEGRANAADALNATLIAMGNPKVANRAYRRKYLTTKQTKYLDDMKHLRRGEIIYPWIIIGVYAIFTALQLLFSATTKDVIFASYLMILMTSWPLRQTPHYFFGSRPVTLLAASAILCVVQTVVAIGIATLAFGYVSAVAFAFGVLTFPGIIAGSLHDILLLRKARGCENRTASQ